jgi:hypothetical protein
MDCLLFFLFVLLVATCGNGLPVQTATTMGKSTTALSSRLLEDNLDSAESLLRRGEKYTPGFKYYPDKENPYSYVEFTNRRPPSASKQVAGIIAGIAKRVLVTVPVKAYNKHVKDGQWRETIKKGKDAIGRFGSKSKIKKKEPASPYPSLNPTAARYQVPTPSTYTGFYTPAARHDVSTFGNRPAPYVPLDNPYVHQNPKYAPSAPYLDPDLQPFSPLHRRSETDPEPSSYTYHTPTSPPRVPVRQIEENLKGFGKKMMRTTRRVYQEGIQGDHLRETLEKGKGKAKQLLGKVAEKNHGLATMLDQKLNKEKRQDSKPERDGRTASSAQSTLFHHDAGGYAPSAPFEPSPPRSPPRRAYRV